MLHGAHDSGTGKHHRRLPGAGIVTEDGYEVRNVFRRNFTTYSTGEPIVPGVDVFHGCHAGGYWVRGVVNTFENNEAWNNRPESICSIRCTSRDAIRYHRRRADTAVNRQTAIPMSFTQHHGREFLVGFEVTGRLAESMPANRGGNNGNRGVFAASSTSSP